MKNIRFIGDCLLHFENCMCTAQQHVRVSNLSQNNEQNRGSVAKAGSCKKTCENVKDPIANKWIISYVNYPYLTLEIKYIEK